MKRTPSGQPLTSIGIVVAAVALSAALGPACSSSNDRAGSGASAAGGSTTTPSGGQGPCGPETEQTACARIVPDSVSPPIDCTPMQPGTPEYDGCTPNTPCGSVHGCVLETCDGVAGVVTTTYAPGDPGYVAPTTLLPAMGTQMTGRATGWFARGDGTLDQGSCAYSPVRNLTGVALATVDFGHADWCGACAEVVGVSGTRVRVQYEATNQF